MNFKYKTFTNQINLFKQTEVPVEFLSFPFIQFRRDVLQRPLNSWNDHCKQKIHKALTINNMVRSLQDLVRPPVALQKYNRKTKNLKAEAAMVLPVMGTS